MIDRAEESELIPMAPSALPEARRVLVLAPHPDDEVFGCGGTLHRLVQSGAAITVIVVSDGALGSAADEPQTEALIAEREAESRTAAETLGYPPPVFWRLPDRGVRYGETLVTRVLQAMRETHADLVLAPALTELHPDHQALALATAEALRRLGGKRSVAFYEVSAPLLPNALIDITTAVERKRAAMRCFRSQLARQPYDEHIAALNRYRSYTLGNGVHAAEAFFIAKAAELAAGVAPLFESALARRRRLGAVTEGAEVPLVSVIVRSMDRPTLAEALASLAAQTYPNIEALVVNAKGGPHSPLPDFGGRLTVRLIDAGASLSRSRAANAGLDAARGRYVAFLDDDDALDPDHLGELVGALTKEGEGAVAYAGVRCMDRNDMERKVSRVFGEPLENRVKLLAGDFIPSHALLFPRHFIDKGVRFDETLHVYENRDFWLQLAERARFVYVDRISATYFTGGTAGASPPCFDPNAAPAAAGMLFAKWKDRVSPDALKTLGTLYHQTKLELLGTRSEVNRLASLLEANEARLQDVQSDLAETSARLSASEARVRETQSALEQTQSNLEGTRSNLERTRSDLEETRSSLERTQSDLHETRSNLERTRSDLEETRSSLEQKTILLASREQHLAEMVATVREIQRSTSWTITAPLRWCGRQCRRAGKLWRELRAAVARGNP